MQPYPGPPPGQPAYGADAFGQPPSGQPAGYEFNQYENATIDQTAVRSRRWGIISLVVGILATLSVITVFVAAQMTPDIPPAVSIAVIGAGLPLTITHIVIAFSYMAAGNSLKAVVQTQGNDIAHMMTGLTKLTRAFSIEAIMSVVGIVLGLVAGVSAQYLNFNP